MPEKPRTGTIVTGLFRPEFSADLVLMGVWLLAGIVAIYLPPLNATTVRILLALPLMLFIPGYCLIAALFPKNDDVDILERIALSFGLSIAVVPLIGLGLNFTPWGIRLDPVVLSLSLFTLLMILAALYRRARLPSEERFRMQFFTITGRKPRELVKRGGNRLDRLLNIVLALAALAAILTTVFVIVFPQEGERFTEFFILGEKRMAADYPDQIVTGLDYPLYIGIGNHEYRTSEYTIETWLLRTEFNTLTNTTSILAMDPGDRLLLALSHNETKVIPYNLSVKKTGYNRVEFLLFKEAVPGFEVTGSDRINASYRNLHLRVTVRDGQSAENSNLVIISS